MCFVVADVLHLTCCETAVRSRCQGYGNSAGLIVVAYKTKVVYFKVRLSIRRGRLLSSAGSAVATQRICEGHWKVRRHTRIGATTLMV